MGTTLGDTPPERLAGTSLLIELPDGRVEPLQARTRGEGAAWTFGPTTISGFYTVRFDAADPQVRIYAVNVDTVESDLAQVTPEELREEVWPGVPFEYCTTWEQAEAPSAAHIGSTSGLAKTFLYAILGLLFAETFLARRFGYHGP